MKRSILTLTLLFSSLPSFAVEYKDDANVSTMKGQLVEVGDRNRYHYNAPTFNLGVNPFGLMTGIYSFDASYALGSVANIRGDFTFNEEDSTWEASIGSQIYFKKMYSGIYLEPGVLRREEGNIFGPQVLLGKTWFWDSGMNVSLAAGVGRNLNEKDDVFGNGYLRVGYAF